MSSFSINTNAGALVALQNLTDTNRQLQTTQTRISTGLAVAGARDNSAAFSIAQGLRGDIGSLNAVQGSLSSAQSTLDVALNAAESVSDLLNEAKEIAVRASDDGSSAATRSALNDDFAALVEQIDSIVNQATFNGINILRDSPDQISAVSSVNDNGTVTRLQVAGADITSDSANATANLANVAFGGTATTATLTTAFFQSLTSSGTFVDSLDGQALLSSLNDLEAGGQNVIVEDGNGNFSFDLSSVTATDLGTNSNAFEISFGGATFRSATFTDTATSTVQNGLRDALSDFTLVGGTSENVTYQAGRTAVGSISLSEVNLTTDRGRAAAIQVIENFSDNISGILSNLGSSSRQIDLQLEFTGQLSDTIQTGIGNLVDANLAQESARLQALQTQQQLGLQALSIANQAPGSILSLFR